MMETMPRAVSSWGIIIFLLLIMKCSHLWVVNSNKAMLGTVEVLKLS